MSQKIGSKQKNSINPVARFVDSVVGVFSPKAAFQRTAFRNYRNNPYTGSRTRYSLSGMQNHGEQTDFSLESLRSYSRTLVGYSSVAGGVVNVKSNNVVGTGLKVRPNIISTLTPMTQEQAKKMSTEIEERFSLWANSNEPDFMDQHSFYELQYTAFMSKLVSGDIAIMLPLDKDSHNPLKIRLIEGDRIRNPNNEQNTDTLVNGIKLSKAGKPIGAYINTASPHDDFSLDRFVYVPFRGKRSGRYNMIMTYTQKRPSQLRGIPDIAPVIETIKQLDRYLDAELEATVVSSLFTAFITTDTGTANPVFGDVAPLVPNVSEEEKDGTEPSYKLAPGAMIPLKRGENVTTATPGRPNDNFDKFFDACMKQVGMATSIPFEVLVQSFNSSFSASRAALMEFWKYVKKERSTFSRQFCQPVYKEWLTEEVISGRIPLPGFFSDPVTTEAYCSADWVGIAQGMVNPVNEVTAAEKRINIGISSRHIEASAIGHDYERVARDLEREVETQQVINTIDDPVDKENAELNKGGTKK